MRKPEYNEFKFLFSDWAQIAFKANDDFESLVKSRISDHKAAEAKRLEQERERMEAEAKAKAEREAAEKAEQNRERIRQEEAAKLKIEQPSPQAIQQPIAQTKTPTEIVNNSSLSEKFANAPVTYDDTELRLYFLKCLIGAGVDNWSGGYDFAVDAFLDKYPNASVPR